MNDCHACMDAYPKPVRQQWACGFEIAGRGPVQAWSHAAYTGPAPTICAGYTTSLPETIEVARAWQWWTKGQLADFVDGERVGEAVKLGIEIFDGSVHALERWLLTPRDQGGGGS